ncbi:hypothetical protein WDZ92_48660, partial [Nostoc sp. NIES-2111]
MHTVPSRLVSAAAASPMAARLIDGLQRSRTILVPPGLAPAPKPRPAPGLGPVLGRIGNLEVRLAVTRKDVVRAQKLRYRVFYE